MIMYIRRFCVGVDGRAGRWWVDRYAGIYIRTYVWRWWGVDFDWFKLEMLAMYVH